MNDWDCDWDNDWDRDGDYDWDYDGDSDLKPHSINFFNSTIKFFYSFSGITGFRNIIFHGDTIVP